MRTGSPPGANCESAQCGLFEKLRGSPGMVTARDETGVVLGEEGYGLVQVSVGARASNAVMKSFLLIILLEFFF